MAGKLVNRTSWRKVPLLCVEFSQLCVAWGKRRQGQQQNMFDLSSSGLGNSKHTASPSYHAQWFELSTGLCATWVWNSPSRRRHSSSHCCASAVMNSCCQPEHTMSRFDNSSHTRQGWGYMESQSPVDLTSLILSHQHTLTKEMNVGRNCPE
jgi:hypothetical protein